MTIRTHRKPLKLILIAGLFSASLASNSFAQSYDDFTKFSAEPEALDNEAREIFGRFFQTELSIGAGLFAGDLGAANSPGVNIGARFIIFFDQIWAMEIGAFYARHSSAYTPTNTGDDAINYPFTTHLITPSVGFRYGFDQESLPRGFSTLNPYFSVNGEIFFRSEKANSLETATVGGFTGDSDKFALNPVNNSSAFAISFGGGAQFDVYKENLYIAIDLRYHFPFWSDKGVKIGDKLHRGGSYFTFLSAFVLNY